MTSTTIQLEKTTLPEAQESSQAFATSVEANVSTRQSRPCFHCGASCREGSTQAAEKAFCCQGCKAVYELLTENGLTEFYQISDKAGVRVRSIPAAEQFRFLDEPVVRERLVQFSDDKITRVQFQISAIHCIACVWLLENLFRVNPAIGESRVDFMDRRLSVTFDPARLLLSDLVALLGRLGYEPELRLSDLEPRSANPANSRMALRLGLAGFAFGNIMLLSIATYLGLDSVSGPTLKSLSTWISLALATPVVIYSASGFWRSFLVSLKQKVLTIDVPIAIGIAAIYIQSVGEVMSGHGEGYFDSLTGLIFFLLCGRWFQLKTFARLSFERDYKSFLPISVNRQTADGEEQISLSQLSVGDRLSVRNGEIIPADSQLRSEAAPLDYSFVTGEAVPVTKQAGDYLYAGGRPTGGSIIVEIIKPVSQSYLTSLWNQEAFRKDKTSSLNSLTNRYSRRFTWIVVTIACSAALFWSLVNPSLALKSFTSVLIVACPCALALAAPFTLGTAVRLLGWGQVYVKGPQVVEDLARIDSIMFDKTGTLTFSSAAGVEFEGAPLSHDEEQQVFALAVHSTHPYSIQICEMLRARHVWMDTDALTVRRFTERAALGLAGEIEGQQLLLGSASWLESQNVPVPLQTGPGSRVHLATGGEYRGAFVVSGGNLRPELAGMLAKVNSSCELSLLSGDNDRERDRFAHLFAGKAQLRFEQSPLEKLRYVEERQAAGRTVLMLGDGLNDAGALKQADVGMAAVENTSTFSPASDVILVGGMIPRLGEILRFSKGTTRIVKLSFLISSLYNVVGIAIAAGGLLSPVVCAILMPLSSATVVAFACGATVWFGRRCGLGQGAKGAQP